jgi:hypothetical protein
MRTLSAPEIAALQLPTLPIVLLVEMDFSSTLYLNSSSLSITTGGNTYLGTAGLGKIEAIQESPAEIKQLKFELSGVPSTSISLALGEPVQGKAVKVSIAIFDPTTYAILGVHLRWAGLVDVMTIEDGVGTAIVSVTAEHAGTDLLRAYPSLYSDAEQQRLNPGDLAFRFNADQVEQRIVWPASTWRPK